VNKELRVGRTLKIVAFSRVPLPKWTIYREVQCQFLQEMKLQEVNGCRTEILISGC